MNKPCRIYTICLVLIFTWGVSSLGTNSSITTDAMRAGSGTIFNADGDGYTIAMWDTGIARPTHVEFQDGPGSRINNMDASFTESHSTLVASVLMATGVDNNAIGMANAATLNCYDFDINHTSEILAVGAIFQPDFDGINRDAASNTVQVGTPTNGNVWTTTERDATAINSSTSKRFMRVEVNK